jgi:alpha-galactosidase
VVALFNRNAAGPANITVQWADLGLQPAGSMAVRDVWAHQDLGAFSGSFTGVAVGEHDVMLLRLHSRTL